jgi:hypothetical protein
MICSASVISQAAEGCMALTDQFLGIVKCQACRTDSTRVYNDFGILYIYILHSRLSDPVFDSALVNTQPHPVTSL